MDLYSIYVSIRNPDNREIARIEIDKADNSKYAEQLVEQYSTMNMRDFPSVIAMMEACRYAQHLSFREIDKMLIVIMKELVS